MLNSRGHRTFAGGLSSSFLALLLTLTCFAVTAQAQPRLAITLSESGNFTIDTCSALYSPQFSNNTGPVPGSCRSSLIIWVTNTGTADTNPNPMTGGGPVTVVSTIVPYMTKSVSLLSAAGTDWLNPLTGLPPCQIAGINLDQAICNRIKVLPKGQTSPGIVISALVEDFAQYGMNDYVLAIGGGADNSPITSLDTNVQFVPISISNNPTFFNKIVTVHSAPEGLSMLVDGVRIQTPHTYAWHSGDQHTITPDPPNEFLPGNPSPWVFTGFSTGGVSHPVGAPAECIDGTPIDQGTCGDGGSGSGSSNPMNGNTLNYVVTSTNYEHVTAIFNRP